MSKTKSCCCCATIAVALIVLLRVGVGCHFLYEGLWKTDPSNGFSAKGFLGMAKGPTKELYYMFLPDLGGDERMQMAEAYRVVLEDGVKRSQKRVGWTFPVIEKEWYSYFKTFKAKYDLSEEQQEEARAVFNQYVLSLREYVLENREEIRGFVASKARFEKALAVAKNDAEYQRIRDWDAELKYRNEGEKFVAEPVAMGVNLQLALWSVLDGKQKSLGEIPAIAYGEDRMPGMGWVASLPFVSRFAKPSTMGLLDLTVTLGLSAIGLCLILGFCTRLACLGGALFMINVVLSQFPWPTVYPYPPEVVGHSMVFNKDSLEMILLLLLAFLPAGRWGGLDWFVWNVFGRPIYRVFGLERDPFVPEALEIEGCN